MSRPACALGRRRGLTLVESVVSILVVGVLLTGAMEALGRAHAARLRDSDRARAAALADDLMSEILALPFVEPDDPPASPAIQLESGEDPSVRTMWDDIDDYHGWSASPPQTRGGDAIPGFDGWSRSVTVDWVDHADPTVPTGAAGPTKRIRVVVERPGGERLERAALRSESWSAGW